MKGFVKLDDGWNQVDVVNIKIDYKPCDEKTAVEPWKEFISAPMKLKN